jgi:glucosamine 6-phosphate synthetase-like amidotransferase/phosphosugar isomerase protein
MTAPTKEAVICSIVGMIGKTPEDRYSETYSLMRELMIAAQVRGTDASGIVYKTAPYGRRSQGRVVISKAAMPAAQFVDSDSAFRALGHRRSSAWLGHCRMATHGDPEACDGQLNNHPFVSRDGSLFLIHNGVLSRHRETADAFALPLETDCDSELLLRITESAPNPIVGLLDCLQVRGTFAIAVYDARQDLVYLIRNAGRPLWLMRVAGAQKWWFASTDDILLTAVERAHGRSSLRRIETLIPIPENTPLVLSPSGRLLTAASP